MKRFLLLAFCACLGTTGLYAQVVKRVGRTTLPMNNRAGDDSDFYDKGSDDVFSFCWFSYDYPSTSGDGQPTTLSAIACMPDGNGEGTVINNVIAGCHITITSNKECPTEYNTSGSTFSDLYFTMLDGGAALRRYGEVLPVAHEWWPCGHGNGVLPQSATPGRNTPAGSHGRRWRRLSSSG